MRCLRQLTYISTVSLILLFGDVLDVARANEAKKGIISLNMPYMDLICYLIPYLCNSQTENNLPQNGLRLVVEVQTTPSIPKISNRELVAVQRVIENRIKRLGISPATVQIQGKNHILIILPQVKDPQQAIRVLGKSGKLEFKEQKKGTEKQLFTLRQANYQLVAEQERLRNRNSSDQNAIAKNNQALQNNNLAISQLFKSTNPPLTGRNIKDAFAQSTQDNYFQPILPPINQRNQNNYSWEIAIKFDEEGSQIFTKVTKNIAGTGRAIGIFIDDKLISSPVVDVIFAKSGITGGSAVISGAFSAEDAQDIALQLQSGALPLPLKVLESTTIKPDKLHK
jgi:preprotein translocase subunit SecD